MAIGLLKNLLLFIFLTFLCFMLVRFLLYLDLNKRVYNHSPGSCSSIAGVEFGAEDVEYIYDNMAIISSGLKQYNNSELANATGRMYMYNTSARTAWELRMESKKLTTKNFFPHGISVWNEKGKTSIFVVNHRPRGETVEVFGFGSDEKQINHLRTVKSPLFQTLEDIAAVSKDKFYALNLHYFRRDFFRQLELYLALPFGNVVYFDGQKSRIVDNWIQTPSGIAIDKSKKWLYVSSLTSERILIYKIEPDFNITYHSAIRLHTAPDNIFVDPYTADLFVACHPIKSRKFRHEQYPKSIYAPSQVIKIHGRPAKGNWTITQVYANDGATLSSSSVCVKIKEKLLIGSSHDKLLACDLDYPNLL